MFGFFRKREIAKLHPTRAEFERIRKALRSGPERDQALIGHAINLVNSLFLHEYKSVDAFIALPFEKRQAYMTVMDAKIQEMKAKGDLLSVVGLDLFRLWLAETSAKTPDTAYLREVETIIVELTKKGAALLPELAAKKDPRREEFDRIKSHLLSLSEAEQIAVGHIINLANSFFVKEHGTIEAFSALSMDARMTYMGALDTTIRKFRERGEQFEVFAFSLFRIWLWGKSTGVTDTSLLQDVTDTMSVLSRKGAILGGLPSKS